MKTILLALCVFVSAVSTADACHRCRCYTHCIYQAAPVVTNKVDVQFRHLRFVNQTPPVSQDEINTELALRRQWEMLTSAIPIAPPIDQRQLFRPFQFRDNLPPYRAAQQVQDEGYQEVRYVRRTKVYRGLVDFSLRVEPGGNVNLIQATQSGTQTQSSTQTQTTTGSGY